MRRATLRYVAEDAPSGYGDAADRLVRALGDAGMRIDYRGWGSEPAIAGLRQHSRASLPNRRASRHAPTIVHLVPEHYPRVRAALPGGPLIAHTVWETDRIPNHWPELLRSVDRVIVPTEWNRAVFEASGIDAPVVVVPHIACEPVPGDRGEPLRLPDDVVVFYTIARWDQRKAPAAVIQAFLEAFTADDPVALVVKTSPQAQYPPPTDWSETSPLLGTTLLEIARITRMYPRPPSIRVEVDDWHPQRVAGLHHRGDCYVSLSHGEGWGLGAFDAATYGNPVVMTGWGGQLAYVDPDAAFLVEYDLEPVRHFLPQSYGPDQRWAVPRLEHAVALMREIATHLDSARRRAAPLREALSHDFGAPRVARDFLDAVPEVTIGRAGRLHRDPAARARRRLDPTALLATTADQSARPSSRGSADQLLLVGLMVGRWQSAFDNWIEMAERFGYKYELVGRGVEPYIPHLTKWRLLLDYYDDLPRKRLVFYLDASDGFVCDDATQALRRYRSYQAPLVLGAEDSPHRVYDFDVPDRRWRWANAGCYVGEAGIIADALRGGYGLVDWEKRGFVCDQAAMIRYLQLPEHRNLATVDYRRTVVENVKASPHRAELAQHRVMRDHGTSHRCTSSIHCLGGNGRGYNAFADLYGLAIQELADSGWYRVSAPSEALP